MTTCAPSTACATFANTNARAARRDWLVHIYVRRVDINLVVIVYINICSLNGLHRGCLALTLALALSLMLTLALALLVLVDI